ncbi:hypothetical protein EKO04_006703 [Ascochyta lentis]|uniref:F-box domain-containing protein n=1 Tax=Ascochyta lentis TaxID=205686 RepID=A0A8H7MHJ2_9PLEO|nr:hypothetical protein EKO04_006703 [Ascochyta lentis]
MLLSLPPEIVEYVIKQVNDRQHLSNARLVCKILDKHATKEIFKDVLVSPGQEHISTWNSINQNDVLRWIPRHAIIHTQPNVDDSDGGEGEAEEIDEDFENAVAALSRFPNLDSVEIGFTPECIGNRQKSFWEDVVESVVQRKEMLTLIFCAIKDRAANDGNRTIRKLTITNLQKLPNSGLHLLQSLSRRHGPTGRTAHLSHAGMQRTRA